MLLRASHLVVFLVLLLTAGAAESKEPPYKRPQLSPSPPIATADPTSTDQWGLENLGERGGLFDADLDASSAWEISKGSPEILVGVLDTGIDISHPDLVDVLWVNEAERDGVAGVDDDGNGCIDDIHGCNFANDCANETVDCVSQPVGASYDLAGHGTQVAGIIAAASKNMSIQGVAPNIKIVVLQIRETNPLWLDTPVYNALSYAKTIGVDIVNISGYFDGSDRVKQEEGLALFTQSGGLIVSTAGNTGLNLLDSTDVYPYLPAQSTNPSVLKVAATDKYETLISYDGYFGSCYGDNVQLAGPGQAIATTASKYASEELYSFDFNGTSAAAPFVSGVAALVWSVAPQLSAAEVRAVLEASVDKLPSLEGKVTSGGRVNASNAVRIATHDVPMHTVSIEGPETLAPGVRETFVVSVEGGEDGPMEFIWDFGDGTQAQSTTDSTVSHHFIRGGESVVTVEAISPSGLRSTGRVRVEVTSDWIDLDTSVVGSFPLESEHPYPPMLTSAELYIPEARFIRLHFERFDLASVGDGIRDSDTFLIEDLWNTPIWTRSASGEDFWTPAIPLFDGKALTRFWGRYPGSYGYKIDRIQIIENKNITEEEVPEEFAENSGCGCSTGNQRGDLFPIGVGVFLLLWLRSRRRTRDGSKRAS